MNREIKNHERLASKERVRKIEIYRKTISGNDTLTKEDTPPKHITNNNKLPVFKIFLMSSIILSIIFMAILVNPFSNSTNNLDKLRKKNIDTIEDKLEPVEEIVPITKKETLFFDKNGNPKTTNIIIAGGILFLILRNVFNLI